MNSLASRQSVPEAAMKMLNELILPYLRKILAISVGILVTVFIAVFGANAWLENKIVNLKFEELNQRVSATEGSIDTIRAYLAIKEKITLSYESVFFISAAERNGDVVYKNASWQLTKKGEMAIPKQIQDFAQKIASKKPEISYDRILMKLYVELSPTELANLYNSSKRTPEQLLGLILVYAKTFKP